MIALVPVCLQRLQQQSYESEIQATRCFPTNREQMVRFCGALEDLGVRGSKLRELYYKGNKSRRQQLTWTSAFRTRCWARELGMGEGAHCAVAPR